MTFGNESAEPAESDALIEAMRVVARPSATPVQSDVAAALAVLRVALAEEAELPRSDEAGADAWSTSARGLRQPLHPGPGAWRGFSG